MQLEQQESYNLWEQKQKTIKECWEVKYIVRLRDRVVRRICKILKFQSVILEVWENWGSVDR
jgi:hypothetical protein